MSLTSVDAVTLLDQYNSFDTIIDARSEGEYALDHLPGAVNWPTLDDAQRHAVGTTYKQVNAFEARKMGAAMAARNIASHIEHGAMAQPKSWRPLVYCWRGGQRSGSLSLILDQIGFRVSIVQGGYKAFRAAMLVDTERLAGLFMYRVVCGTTGSGKTRLLHALARAGAQVLDLEGLAHHRSSVLGAIPGVPQPTQKAFDTRVWNALRQFDPDRPVFLESESRKVGNVAVPVALMDAMRTQGQCMNLVLPDHERVALLMEDYDFFVRDAEAFCSRLDALTEIRGKAVVQAWQSAVRAGNLPDVVQELLNKHYDPVYQQSMQRNFTHFADAPTLTPADRSATAMDAVAADLVGGSVDAGAALSN
ncbi:MAG: tRNA 2-selenouridine(34) synthase MnmH [Burkholderiaceae bacterium]